MVIMATTYKSTSNYSKTASNSKYLETYIPPISNTSNIETYSTVISAKYNFRPDLMAHDLFGKKDYWWIFVILNRDEIVDPIYDFTTGKTIKVPKSINSLGI